MSRKKPRPVPVPHEFIPQLTDAHTHIYSCGARTEAETRTLVDRAADAGVEKIVTVGDDLVESEAAIAQAHWDHRVWAAVAIHPTNATELIGPEGIVDQNVAKRLHELAADGRCVAVGETGLDYYWIQHEPDTTAPKDVQEQSLRWHIDLAIEVDKPLMIHNREADADLMAILADAPQPTTTILHCFSSPLAVAEEAMHRGYILSLCGNSTFNRNEDLREAARIAPIEQLLVETDAPYMTPEPFRGGRNESAIIGHTFAQLAEARNQDVEDFAHGIYQTFSRVYGV